MQDKEARGNDDRRQRGSQPDHDALIKLQGLQLYAKRMSVMAQPTIRSGSCASRTSRLPAGSCSARQFAQQVEAAGQVTHILSR